MLSRAGLEVVSRLDPAAILVFQLERRVLDVEVLGEALRERVERPVRVRLLGENDMCRDDVHPGSDRPGVEIVAVHHPGRLEDVPANVGETFVHDNKFTDRSKV